MTTAIDSAVYILTKEIKPKIGINLHRFLYYSQAWHMIWENEPLFYERIEAWISGPIIPEIFEIGKKYDSRNDDIDIYKKEGGDICNLSDDQKESIDAVIEYYRDYSMTDLSNLSMNEDPYKIARKNVICNVRGNSEITRESMISYYSRLYTCENCRHTNLIENIEDNLCQIITK